MKASNLAVCRLASLEYRGDTQVAPYTCRVLRDR